jgi:hypothetical protein
LLIDDSHAKREKETVVEQLLLAQAAHFSEQCGCEKERLPSIAALRKASDADSELESWIKCLQLE